MNYIKTVKAQMAKAGEAVTLAKEIALYTSVKFPEVTMQVKAEELANEVAVHFAVAAEAEALAHLQEQSGVDGLLQNLAQQFARLFVNGRLQDVFCGDCGVTAVP